MNPEDTLARWARDRSRADVPAGFADRLAASLPSSRHPASRLPWAARAALLLIGLGAFAFRLGSVFALLWAR